MRHISAEDYLRTIYNIYESSGTVQSIEISRTLQVSKPSVSEMIRKLAKKGYLKVSPYSTIRLTQKGIAEARRITNAHRIIEVFLNKVLGYPVENTHDEAHRLEHAFSPDAIKRLESFLNNPKTCPHGNIIK